MKKKLLATVISLLIFTSCSFSNKKLSKTDKERIKFFKTIAKYIEDYKKVKGYFPLSNGKHQLPVVVYLHTEIEKVDYPIHYNKVTILDYEILIAELKLVLGESVNLISLAIAFAILP